MDHIVAPQSSSFQPVFPAFPHKDEGRSQGFFERLQSDFESGTIGWVGDFRDFALGYLTFASTLLARVPNSHARPVGSVVIGESSTGKTELANSLMRLFPEEHAICVTSLSAKSLIYRCLKDPTHLNGKVVFVEELSGLKNEDLQYLLRILVTRGEVRHVTVVNGKPVEIYAKGHISLQTTGLPTDRLRDDTMNRLITIHSDSSAHMTARVISEIKKRYSGRHQTPSHVNEANDWYKAFYASLKPYHVIIPFADDLPISGYEPASRRMSKIILDLLCTVALINQHHRTIQGSELIAEPGDFEILKGFLKESTDRRQTTLSSRENAVLEAARALTNRNDFGYDDLMGARAGSSVGIEGGYSLTSIKYAVSRLVAAGLLRDLGRRSRVARFSLVSD